MSADVQRDGRPGKYRWRPLSNAAVCLTPSAGVPCSNAANTRNPLKLPGVPQTTGPPLVGRSLPHCEDMWRRYCCITSSFLTVDTCLSCEDIARQSCAMVPKWQFFWCFCASCIFSELRAPRLRPAS